jgi:drug/metabolite transporter (DMT)-like permease
MAERETRPARAGEEGRGLLYILISALAYGSMPIVGKLTYAAGVTSLMALAWRFAVAVAIFALLKRRGEPALPWRRRLSLWALGVVFVGNAFTYFAALETVPAATAAVLVYTYPVLVLLLSALLGLEPLTLRGLLAALLAFAGCALTTGGLAGIAGDRGVILVLMSALIYATYVVLGGRFAADVPAEVAARHLVQAAAAVLVPWAAWRGELLLPPAPAAWAGVLALGSLCTVVPIRAFLAGLQRIGPGRAAVLSSVEVILTIVLAVILLGEPLGLRQLAGALLILGAVGLQNLRVLRRDPAPSS